MSDLPIPEYSPHRCVPTEDAYNAAVAALEAHRRRADAAEAALADLTSRATVVAHEYDREPRFLASTTVAKMLREWVNA